MNVFLNLVLVVQLLSALSMIGLILVQHGKGADMGAAFGSGSSGSLFGASGSANFLSRSTAVLAAVFFVCTLTLAYFGFGVRTAAPSSGSVLDRAPISAPASGASSPVPAGSAANPAAAIPAGVAAVPGASAALPAPAPMPAASGAAQIPTK